MELRTPRILVVDDLVDWRHTLGGLLRDEGYSVEVAASADEAKALLEAGPFDLAVVDVRLHEPDEQNVEGLTLARHIRDHWPSVRVVAITGHDTAGTLEKAMVPDRQGRRLVQEFVLKSDTAELARIVKRLVGEPRS